MSVAGAKDTSNEGSFICIVCKSRKHCEMLSLEGKRCVEEDFSIKFMKLVTKKFYETLCDSLKTHNNKNYVCRSCFLVVLNTYNGIVRLQTGVAQSIKKRLMTLQPKNEEQQRGNNVEFQPLDIRKKNNASLQGTSKKELGKSGIKSLKLVSINNKYPQIILEKELLNSNSSHTEQSLLGSTLKSRNISGSFDKASASINPPSFSGKYNWEKRDNLISQVSQNDGTEQSENRLGLESLLVAARVVETDEASLKGFSNSDISRKNNLSSMKNVSKNSKSMFLASRPGPLSWKQRFTNKPGPLSWKQRTNRSILPSKPTTDQVKNVFVKSCMPVDLARVKDNAIHMCTEPKCEWLFLSAFSLYNHIKHLHNNGKPHKCSFGGCEKIFGTKSKLKDHIKTHRGEKTYACGICGKGYSQSSNLKFHMVSHTDKADVKEYTCSIPGCNLSYKYRHTLKRHLAFHDGGVLPFPCTHPGCTKAFKSKYELKCHYRHHTGEKPYKCDEPGCGKSFRLPGQYTIHRRNHTGERPFKCTWEGCEAAYGCRGQLESHFLAHQGKTFVCDTCGKTFTYKVAMLIHRKKAHTEERDFACQVDGCGKAFHFRFELNAHITKVHNANKHIVKTKKRKIVRGTKKLFLLYPCPVKGCTKEYVSKPNIEKHLERAHGLTDAKVEPITRPDVLICSVEGCGSQFLTERNLRYHKMSSHNPLSIRFRRAYGNKRFSCTFEGCQRVYETMNALREHLARVHTSIPREKMCFLCGAPFKHIQQLEIHRQVMHGEDSVLNEQKAGIYQCFAEKCGLRFFNAEDLKQHVHVHIENPPYKCDFAGCRRSFLTNKNYNSHVLVHNDQKSHSCGFQGCEEKFRTQIQLMKHSLQHYGNYKCPVEGCARMLTALKSARVHLFRHTGERPYICSVCGASFAISSNWLRHTRTHTGEKPFECKVCLKRFVDKVVLTTHMRRHTGEKPYICKLCGSCFSTLASIKTHMRFHTGESPYVCTVEGCDKRFRDVSGLNSHKNVHNKASHLCSQCGKVYKWSLKKHRCRIVPETVVASTSADSDGVSKNINYKQAQQLQHQQQQKIQEPPPPQKRQQQQHHHQQQQQHQQQQPHQYQQQEQAEQNVMQQRQQLQSISMLLQKQQQQQEHQQQQQGEQHQAQAFPIHTIQVQKTPLPLQQHQQQTQSLPLLPPIDAPEQLPLQQTPLHIMSIIQQPSTSHQQPPQPQQQQQQQHSVTLIKASFPPPNIGFHQSTQPLRPQRPVSVQQQPVAEQATAPTPYAMMQHQLQARVSYVLDNDIANNVETGRRTAKLDGGSSTDQIALHDMDSNYRVVYDRK